MTTPASSITPNSTRAMAVLQSQGWTPAQAAGLVGNFQFESRPAMDPTASNSEGGGHVGIAQWGKTRQADYLALTGKPLSGASLDEQLSFVNYELTRGKEQAAGNALQATTSASSAADVVYNQYERPGPTDASLPQRQKYANEKVGTAGETVVDPNTGQVLRVAPPGSRLNFGGEPSEPVKAEPLLFDKPLVNPLLAYPSYTYGLSLHMMTPSEYETVVKTQEYVAKRVLVASAGRHDPKTLIRSPFFKEDFFFENLTMNTIVGLCADSRATNVISLKFDLVEPYGLTLLDRIIDASQADDVKAPNYLALPYMLQIDFFAINDAGEVVGMLVNPSYSKYIPISLLSMNITTGPEGSKYAIDAVPFNHSAYDMGSVTTPVNLNIVAGTVSEFFQSLEGNADAGATFNNARDEVKKTAVNLPGGGQGGKISPAPAAAINTSSIYRVKSYSGGLNAYYADLKAKKKITSADTYAFVFYGGIADAKFNLQDLSSPKTAPMDSGSGIISSIANVGGSTALEKGKRIFTVNAGTSVDQVIGFIVRSSSFILDQLIVPSDYKTKEDFEKAQKNNAGPLKWFKITPTIKLGEYDKGQEKYAKEITYHVYPYETRNSKLSTGPTEKATKPIKEYNYYYTGKNNDVMDVEIQFNATYYTSVTNYSANMAQLANIPEKDATLNNQNASPQEIKSTDVLTRNAQRITPTNAQNRNSDEATPKEHAAMDQQTSLYTNAVADMLSINVKIVGDPHFIKQDDLFYPPQVTVPKNENPDSKIDPRLTANGSIISDNSELYAKLNFRSPVDIDEDTGMMRFDQKYKEGKFTGIYRIISVENIFAGGKFEQRLEMVRMANQDITPVTKILLDKQARAETGNSVPGQAAISETYMGAPPFSAPHVDDAPAPQASAVGTPAAAAPNDAIPSHASANSGLTALQSIKSSGTAGPASSIFAVAPIPDKIDFSNPQNQTVQQFGRV